MLPIQNGSYFGEIFLDNANMDAYMWDGNQWCLMINQNNYSSTIQNIKRNRILDKLDGIDTNDIIDTMFILLVKANIIKDIDEFKEMIVANKLASDLSKT